MWAIGAHPTVHEKEKDKKERKRVGDDDILPGGNAAKKASAGKRSDVGTASINDAISKVPPPSGSTSTYSSNTVFKYTNKNRPPYVVQVQSIDDADSSSLPVR